MKKKKHNVTALNTQFSRKSRIDACVSVVFVPIYLSGFWI
jgi:hypothetical protein